MSWHHLFNWLPSRAARRTRRAQKPVPPWRFVVPRLERLESRIAPAAVPTVTLPPPTTTLIGDTEQMSVTFSNTGDAPGYGPFVDVELPTAGNVPASSNGLSYITGSATYLGQSVQTQVLTFDASGHVTHPFLLTSSGQPAVITGTPGDELVVFTLPLGSFTPGQPSATIDFSTQLSTLATLNVPLTVSATGGFEFGADPENDPTVDPPIVGSTTTTTVTPTLFQIQKTYLGPEQETATGPNFVQQYQVSVRVAAGQTITNFDLKDVLPTNMQFVSVDLLHANGATVITPVSIPSTTTPGGILEGLFDQVVGTGSQSDVLVDYSFYVPQFDAAGNPVLPPGTGTNAPVTNNVTGTGTFVPLPGSGNTGGTVTDSATDTITAKQLAIQKSVEDITNPGSSGTARGDTLQYTINFQVSDFFALENLIATDVFSDGQSFDPTFAPTIDFTQHDDTVSGAFPAGTFIVSRDTTTTGQTTISFDVAQALAALGLPTGTMIFGGDVFAPGDTHLPPFAGTTGTITFRTVVDNTFLVQPSPNAPVVQGDQFGDNASASAAVLNNITHNPTGNTASDNTSATIAIPHGVFTKSVYAVNGVVGASPNTVTVGDQVTYQLNFTLPQGNVKNYQLNDYLPLPIFPITSMTFIPGQGIPAVNTATFGPSDTFFAASDIVPTTTVNTTTNSVNFDFGGFSTPNLDDLNSDILFTVQVGDTPFADGLFLSNLGVASEDSNTGGSFSSSEIAQIKLNEPSLVITKGVVSTDSATAAFTTAPAPPGVTFAAPGTTTSPPFTGLINTTGLASSPIDADLLNAQSGDLVRFAIVVENVGEGQHGAFNVIIEDAFPTSPVPNYTFVPGSLQVDDGAGDPLAFTGNLFTGITLTDPSPITGALGPGFTTAGAPIDDGSNIAVITYDVQLDNGVLDNLPLVNTSTLTNYTGSPTGANFVPEGLTTQASVTPAHATVTKELVSTSIINADNTLTQATIGERVDYQVTAFFPDVTTPDAMLVDDLGPINLAFVNDVPVTITATSGLSFSVTPIPVLTNNGQTLTINFGTISNNDGADQEVTVTFEAVVLNVAANVNGVTFANTAVASSADGSQSVTSAPVTIIEPKLTTTKNVSISGGTTAQGGSTVTYTMTIAQAADSTTDAYNTDFSDALPLLPGGGSVLLSPTFTVSDPLGLVTNANFQLTGSDAAGWVLSTTPTGDFDLLKSQTGRVITITVTGTVPNSVVAGEQFTNTDDVQWTSLPGTPTIPSDNPNATERTGSGSPPVNNYFADSSATFVIAAPSINKVLVGTSIINGNNGLSQAVIGEQAEYRVTVTVPNGHIPAAQVVDQLPAGLAFVKLVSFTNNSPGVVTLTGNPNSPLVANNGQTVTFNLGDVTNNSTDPTSVQTLTFVYDAVVLNVASNVAGTTLNNAAQVVWNDGTNNSNIASASPVTVIEPQVQTSKSVSGGGTFNPGDPISYTITLQQGNSVDANNVTLTDPLPQLPGGLSLILSPTFTVSDPFGRAATENSFQLTGSNATGWTLSSNPADPLDLISIEPNRVVTIIISGTVSPLAIPGSTFTNTDNVQWTSLPGPNPGPISPFNPDSTERTGTGTPAVNDYFANASVPAMINEASPTLVTMASPNVTLPTGPPGTVTLTDTADLEGGFSPTGSIVFTLTGPGSFTYTQTDTVNGNGIYTASTTLPTTGMVAGNYTWTAHYSGDTHNNVANDQGGTEEQTVVSPASPTLTTTPDPTTVTLGDTAPPVLTDTATLSGGYYPTGDITFDLFQGSTLVHTETVTFNGNGSYTAPTGFTLPTSGTVAGGYVWVAIYSGDDNNDEVSESNPVAEVVTVNPASPTIVTTASPTTVTLPAPVPTILSDTADLEGGFNPTGNIVFTLTGPGGFTYTQTDTVNGNGTYTASTTLPTTGTVAGTYTWTAIYEGDANNNGAADQGGTAEQTVVGPASLTLVTMASPNVTLPTGPPGTVTLSDSAVLSGGQSPTGSIVFTLSGPGGFTYTQTDTVNGNGTYTASTTLPITGTVAGTYTWTATYSGDPNNNAANDQGGIAEQTVVGPVKPTLVTLASPLVKTLPTAPPGTVTLSDSAFLLGGYFPTGSIVFTLTGPGSFMYTQTDTVSGNGIYTASTTLPTTGMVAGTYTWTATYSGDPNNNTANDQGGITEQSVVRPASPTLVTIASPAIRQGTAAPTLTDVAVLSGGYFPTGSIVFTLTGPGGFTYTQTDMVTGNGTYTASTTLPTTGTVAGTYTWTAIYEGDDNNTEAGDEGGTEEQTVVSPTSPTIVTIASPSTALLGTTLEDVAVLTGGYFSTGTITFKLYAPGVDPTVGPPAFTTVIGVNGDGTYQTPLGFVANASGTWHWVATYNGDANNNSMSSGPLDEPVTIQEADVALTKLVNNTTPIFGTPVTYTLIVHNNGPDTANDVVVTDILPVGLVFVSATPSQGSFNPGTGQWTIGTLPNGATATLQITGLVAIIGPITNAASVKGDQFDPDLANNSSAVTIDGMFAAGQISKRLFLSSSDVPLNPATLAAEEALFNELFPIAVNIWDTLLSLAQSVLAARNEPGPGNGGVPVFEGNWLGSPLVVYADPFGGQVTAVQVGAFDFLYENNAVAGVRLV